MLLIKGVRSTLTRAYTRFSEERYGLTALLNLHNHNLYEVRLQKGILQTWDQGEQKHAVLTMINHFDIMYIYFKLKKSAKQTHHNKNNNQDRYAPMVCNCLVVWSFELITRTSDKRNSPRKPQREQLFILWSPKKK
jgi:hypothetical protein